MGINTVPILGAVLYKELHPKDINIQWWEYEKGEGNNPPHSIPGLLPTYGSFNGESIHNLIEEMPDVPEVPPVTRRQGTGTKPWTLAAFVQAQYAYWKKDNARRATVLAAMEARPAIVTEDEPTYSAIYTKSQWDAVLTNPPETADIEQEVYGHWVAAYRDPSMAVSNCGLTICLEPETIKKLVRKQTVVRTSTVDEAPTWRVQQPTTWRATYRTINPTNGETDVVASTFPDFASAKAWARANSLAQAGNYAAWLEAFNELIGTERYVYTGFSDSAEFTPVLTVPAGNIYAPSGNYPWPQPASCGGGHTATDFGVATGGPGYTVLPDMTTYPVYPRTDGPGVDPVAGGEYLTADSYDLLGYGPTRLIVTAGRKKTVPMYTDALYLENPAAGYYPGEVEALKARKVGYCAIVATKVGSVETPFECSPVAKWPSGFSSACEIPYGNIPIDPDKGNLCNVSMELDPNDFVDLELNDLWPPEPPVVIPETTFLLQDGTEEPLYPTMYGSFVYDTHLKKWGKYSGAFKQLLDYSPVNSPQNGIQSYAKFGILGGIVDPTGTIRLFDTEPVRSRLVVGKFGYTRQGMTSPEEVRVHMRIPCTGSIQLNTSIEGKVYTLSLNQLQNFTNAVEATLYGGYSGRWHNVVLEGKYDVSYLEFRGISQGHR